MTKLAKNVFEGTLAEVRRAAFVRGLEVGEYEGAVVEMNGSFATYAPADRNNFSRCYLKDANGSYAGLIQKTQNAYAVVFNN